MNEESTKSFQDSLFTALNLFNNHEWYEAHDAFEEIWNSVDGDERQAVSYTHLRAHETDTCKIPWITCLSSPSTEFHISSKAS